MHDREKNTCVFYLGLHAPLGLFSSSVCVCTWFVLAEEGRGLDTMGPKMSRSSLMGALPAAPTLLPTDPAAGVSDQRQTEGDGEKSRQIERKRKNRREGERWERERERNTH